MNTIITGSRSSGKNREAILALLRLWPKGKVAFVSKEGVRISEEADAEEISDTNAVK